MVHLKDANNILACLIKNLQPIFSQRLSGLLKNLDEISPDLRKAVMYRGVQVWGQLTPQAGGLIQLGQNFLQIMLDSFVHAGETIESKSPRHVTYHCLSLFSCQLLNLAWAVWCFTQQVVAEQST